MAKWKMAGQMAVAMREAERAFQEKKMKEEQFMESEKNGTILRALKRSRHRVGNGAMANDINFGRWFHTLESELTENEKNSMVASCRRYQLQDSQHQRDVLTYIGSLDEHQEEARTIKSAIQMAKIKEHETNREIHKVRLELWRFHQQLDKCRAPALDKVKKRIQVTQEATGLQMAHNRQLTDLIRHLEGQRGLVVHIHKRLKHELDDLSKQLGEHTEQAKVTYDQRDLNTRNIEKLQEHMSRNLTGHNNDMQNLQFKIDVLRKMEDFMMTKNKFRPDLMRERRKESRRQLTDAERDTLALQELVRKIQKDLKEPDVNIIINTFVQMEAENIMLFSNISHVRDNCHQLQGEITSLKKTVRDMHIKEHQEKLEGLARKSEVEEKISICRAAAEKKEVEEKEADDVINTYIRAVKEILGRMKYTPEELAQLAGIFRKVEARNISTFLAEVEYYVNHLHELCATMEHHKWVTARRLSLSMTNPLPESMPPRQSPLPRVVVVPPQTEGEWSVVPAPGGGDGEEAGASDSTHLLDVTEAVRPLELWEIRAHVEENLESDSTHELASLE